VELNLDTSLRVSLLNILKRKRRRKGKKKDTLIEMPLMGMERERTMHCYTVGH